MKADPLTHLRRLIEEPGARPHPETLRAVVAEVERLREENRRLRDRAGVGQLHAGYRGETAAAEGRGRMADIGEPLRRVKIIPLTEPVRGPEPERHTPAPQPKEPAKEPQRVDG